MPLTLPFGTLYLDRTDIAPLASFPIGPSGTGSVTSTLPASSFPSLALDVQGAIVTGGGAISPTNYLAVAWFANSIATQILTAKYDPRNDSFAIRGKGPSGELMEVFRRNGGGQRERLGGITTPFTTFDWNLSSIGFVPPGEIEVVVLGTIRILHLR